MHSSRDSSIDMTNADSLPTNAQLWARYPGAKGFEFPAQFTPSHQQQFFQQLKQASTVDDDVEEVVQIDTPDIIAPPPLPSDTRPSSRLDSTTSSTQFMLEVEEAVSPDDNNDRTVLEQLNEPEQTNLLAATDDSPFEPTLSEESLTPCDSNQSTVTSLAELLRKEQKKKNEKPDEST